MLADVEAKEKVNYQLFYRTMTSRLERDPDDNWSTSELDTEKSLTPVTPKQHGITSSAAPPSSPRNQVTIGLN